MRVKRGVSARHRHRKVLKATKGYHALGSRTYRHAYEVWMKAGQDAYKGRKKLKRDMRSLWIIRLNAAARQHGMNYRDFIAAVNKSKIGINRKMLSEIAIHEPETFGAIVKAVKR